MLVGKRISNKIDYEKLKDLGFLHGPTLTTSSTSQPNTSSAIQEPVVDTKETKPAVSSRTRYVLFKPLSFAIQLIRVLRLA